MFGLLGDGDAHRKAHTYVIDFILLMQKYIQSVQHCVTPTAIKTMSGLHFISCLRSSCALIPPGFAIYIYILFP